MHEEAGHPIPAGTRAGSFSRAVTVGKLQTASFGSKLLAPVTNLAYKWYARQLTAEVTSRPLPRHVAMILDGNRRFARNRGLPDIADGHRYGADKVSEVVKWCDELDIPVVTLWALSTDNLENRDPGEVGKLFEILTNQIEVLSRDASNGEVKRHVRAMGSLDLLPEHVRTRIEASRQKSPESGSRLLNIALAYGGRDEILDAFRQMLRVRGTSGEDALEIAERLSKEDLQAYLYAPDVPEPDLIIRTSGEARLGGFLLWQSVYSELYFCDALWPAFRRIDFLRAIRSFQARQRRFGQ